MRPSPILLHQIAYSEDTWNQVAPGFIALDNRANERPDWAEYWPIRNFLLQAELDEDAFHGFVSPRFAEKLHCEAADILQFVTAAAAAADGAEVAAFSPYFDLQAAFQNPFEQGEFFHPGLMELAWKTLREVVPELDPRTQQCSLDHAIYCNYFAARPRFWRRWLGVCEHIFAMAENPQHALYPALNRSYAHRGTGHAKVFIIERIASLLLAAGNVKVARFAQSSLSASFAHIDPEWFERMAALKARVVGGDTDALPAFRAMQLELFDSDDARQERRRLQRESEEHGVLHTPSPGYEQWGSTAKPAATPATTPATTPETTQAAPQKQPGVWRLLRNIVSGKM